MEARHQIVAEEARRMPTWMEMARMAIGTKLMA